MSLSVIRKKFDVPASFGGRIKVHGSTGTIIGARGDNLVVSLDSSGMKIQIRPDDPAVSYTKKERIRRDAPITMDMIFRR